MAKARKTSGKRSERTPADLSLRRAGKVKGGVPAVRSRTKDLQNQDRLGNFEIQNLMSAFNEAAN